MPKNRLHRHKSHKAAANVFATSGEKQQPALGNQPFSDRRDFQELQEYLEVLKGTRQLEYDRLPLALSTPVVAKDIQNHINFLDGQIAEIQKIIQDVFDTHPEFRQPGGTFNG